MSSNLLQRPNFTFPHVIWNQNGEPSSSSHSKIQKTLKYAKNGNWNWFGLALSLLALNQCIRWQWNAFKKNSESSAKKEKSRNLCLFETSPNAGEGDNHDHLIILLKKIKNFDAIIHPHTRFLRFFLHISELFVFCCG